MHRYTVQVFLLLAFALFTTVFASGQTPPVEASQNDRLLRLERRLAEVESRSNSSTRNVAGTSGVAFLFGAFCALWAQNTQRSAWLWFFLGVFFSVIAVIAALIKNSDDRFDRQQKERYTHGRP